MPASAPIEFYFDFSSPYGYFAATRIEALAAEIGRMVDWRPYLLGIVFKTTGQSPLLGQPLRGDYHRRDMARSARRLGLAFSIPPFFPVSGLAAGRAFYWLRARQPEAASRLVLALFAALFAEGRNIDTPAIVAEIAAPIFARPVAEILAGMESPEARGALRQATEGAIAKGVFGSPYFIVDGEPFWGHDRLEQMRDWAKNGGW